MALLVLIGGAPAGAASPDEARLFPHSKLVIRDRFSDEIIGAGPDLVLIPGLASSRETWRATAESLRGRYRLHLIQIAGFAGEPARANAGGPVLVPTAEAIDAYLVSQKLTPAVLIGHSMGGTIVLYLAETHPADLRKAMMVDALPFFGALRSPGASVDSVRPEAAKVRDAMRAAAATPKTAEELEPQLRTMSKDAPTRLMIARWAVASDPEVAAEAMYDDLTLDLRPGLSAVKTPMVLLYPDNAPMGVPPGAMERVYSRLYAAAPAVKTQAVAGSQHFIMFDQPQLFSQALADFLSAP